MHLGTFFEMQILKKYMSQFYKIELQAHESKTSIKIIILSSWWRPNVYGYSFNFSYSSHNLSKF
jgi:hypothetical protein